MSEMIERVARAIYDKLRDGGEYVSDQYIDPRDEGTPDFRNIEPFTCVTIDGSYDLREVARAAIVAMQPEMHKMLGALADIANAKDMDEKTRRRKAARIYGEMSPVLEAIFQTPVER